MGEKVFSVSMLIDPLHMVSLTLRHSHALTLNECYPIECIACIWGNLMSSIKSIRYKNSVYFLYRTRIK
ncbi:hypothetical protein LLB_0593 [Legionella longbeachae D-4968]|nr:hypothetical protein LLB_0593 [Legionella longbeachae D-4968]